MGKRKYSRSEILSFIGHHMQEHDYAPTLEEIGEEFGCQHSSTIYYILKGLVEEGVLIKEYGKHRTYRLVNAVGTKTLLKKSGLVLVPRWLVDHMLRQIPDGDEKEFVRLALSDF